MIKTTLSWRLLACAALVGLIAGPPAAAEPYLAVANGLKCVSCHVNPTGGGKRNVLGTTYARTQLAAHIAGPDDADNAWNGELGTRFAIGGDLRGGYRDVDIPGLRNTSELATDSASLYLEIRALPERLSFYFDEHLAPDDVDEREHYALITPFERKLAIKVGQFFLPFGLRLQDDGTFVRQRSGINFATPDDGVEVGLELPKWSAQAALTNGTAGSGSAPGKDQLSLSAAFVRPRWRVGASYNLSDDPRGDREMQALFAGLRTGKIAWLAELDFITDKVPGGASTDIRASLLEGNWQFRKGFNLKAAYEFLDPSNAFNEDEEERYSVVLEYSPLQLLQTRAGYRTHNGVPERPLSNRDELFIELHAYF